MDIYIYLWLGYFFWRKDCARRIRVSDLCFEFRHAPSQRRTLLGTGGKKSIHILNDESIPISLPPGLPLPPPSAARAAAPPPGALGRWPRPPAMFCGAANGRWTRRGARVRGSSGAPGDQGCGERVDGTLYKKRTGKSPPLKTVQLFLWAMFAMLNYQRVYDDSRMFGKSEWKLLLSWLKCVDVMIGWTVAREWL